MEEAGKYLAVAMQVECTLLPAVTARRGRERGASEPDQKSESRGKEVPLARTDFEKRISLNPPPFY